MSLKTAKFLLIGEFFCLACSISLAQEVVHAVTGVATRVDPVAHTLTVTTSDGALVLQDESKNHPRFDFDKTLQAETTDCAAFNKPGDPVIVYYLEKGSQQEAIAVEDLGQMPLKSSSGEITHWDHHHHAVTIKAADGSKQTFQLDGKTAVETPMGVVGGDKFEGQNGDRLSIKYLSKDGNNEAVFLRES